VVLLVGGIVVLLISRESVCWYWKVNAALDALTRVEAVLRNIDQNLVTLAGDRRNDQPPR
jgi:hypothetical protein